MQVYNAVSACDKNPLPQTHHEDLPKLTEATEAETDDKAVTASQRLLPVELCSAYQRHLSTLCGAFLAYRSRHVGVAIQLSTPKLK
jgi:hypothetical protein